MPEPDPGKLKARTAAPTTTARRKGVCCICHTSIRTGETIALNVMLQQWGHLRCVDPDRAPEAAQPAAPASLPAAGTSPQPTARRRLPTATSQDGDARMLPFLYLRADLGDIYNDGRLPVACPQCGDMNLHLDVVGFASGDFDELRRSQEVSFPDCLVADSPDTAALQEALHYRGPMLAIQYLCEAGCRGRIELRDHKGSLFGSLHNLPPEPEVDIDDEDEDAALHMSGA
ncbi:hypothetical protein [Nonomuraea sp. NPDC049480]|uniref:hypothetical protein n=1 Tax=Nonomuraea sp. NPDC049480 TaxID=3364353 RepID=UPI00379BB21B